jgi:hypothetical protein
MNMDFHCQALEDMAARHLVQVRLGLIPIREVWLTVDPVGGVLFDDMEQSNPRSKRFGQRRCGRED